MSLDQYNWIKEKKIDGGNSQSKAFIVINANDSNSAKYFLKELVNNDEKRRKRFLRESTCYRTLDHPNIPKFIHSNAEDNRSSSLYIVTELINGQTLENYINRKGAFDANQAINLTIKLLDILEYIHSENTYHRDIKPDNIILRNNNINDPVLVDFGMSFLLIEEEDFATHKNEEIGNRFLRLPEFSVGNSNKQDPRSDVTFCVGILFYLLTSIRPSQLIDDEGNRPHQTDAARKKIQRIINLDIFALLDIFDRGFESKIHARWSSATELKAILKKLELTINNMNENLSADDKIKRIKSFMDSHEEKQRAHISSILFKVGNTVLEGRDEALIELGNNLGSSTSGPIIHAIERKAVVYAGIIKISDHSSGFLPEIHCVMEGEEVIIKAKSNLTPDCDYKILFRFLVNDFENIKNELITAMKKFQFDGVFKILNKHN